MASEIRVNSFTNRSGLSTVSLSDTGAVISGIVTATNFSGKLNNNNYPSAGPLSNRNLVINGAMQVAQRGTSSTLAHDGTTEVYTLDRFYFASGNLDSWDGTVTQVSDAPAGFSNSLKVTTGTAETTVDSDEYAYIQQRIEAQNLQHINNGTSDALPLKLSFWVKTSQTGTYGFSIYKDDNTARLITATYTTTTTGWEYKTIDIPGDTGGGGIDNNNGVGIRLYWPFASGSGLNSTDSTSWMNYVSTGLFYGHAQNATATTASATWQITGVQLEVGTVATPFEQRSYGDELAKCQRYCQRFTYFTAPGVVSSSVSTWHPIAFPVAFRAAPSLTVNTLGSVVKEGTAWYANTAINLVNTNVLNGNLNCNQSNNNMVALNATRLGEGCDLTFHAEL